MNLRKIKILFVFFLKMAAAVLMLAILVIVIYPTDRIVISDDMEKTVAGQEKKEEVKKIVSPPVATPDPKAKLIALTFDDGPLIGVTDRILDILEKHQVKATFFVIGRQVEEGAGLVKRAIGLGCEIGNHTWEHRTLTKCTEKEIRTTIQRTYNAVKKYAGYHAKLVRPTYGEVNDKVRKNVKAPMIYWCVDTEDWRSENSKKIQKKIVGKVKDGDIVLMHDVYSTTADALEKIIPYLKKSGYELVTVSELMKRKGIRLSNETVYYSGK